MSNRRDFLRTTSGVGATAAVGFVPAAHAQTAAGSPDTRGPVFDIGAFGAIGDGKAIDTPAVNKAIEAAAAAGGGVVRFPAGSFVCYSIRLKSNITLLLEPGASIIAGETPMEEARIRADMMPRSPTPRRITTRISAIPIFITA